MKKFNFLKFSLGLALLASPVLGTAQDMFHGEPSNWYSQYVGTRVVVVSPSSVAKSLNHTLSADGGQNDWGALIPSNGSMLNIEVVKADPYEVCTPLTNGGALVGKIALVQRGNCEFGAKAKAVQDAGAIACIIVNQMDGGPVGMGAGAQGNLVNIPVIMISKDDGAAISNALSQGTVTMSLGRWGNNLGNDIGFVDRGLSQWHNFSIPYHQLTSATLSKDPYKGINGAVIANFGSKDQTNVKVKATVRWTPEGGSSQVIHTDSVIRATFDVADSIITPFVNSTYQLAAASGPGRYDVDYELSSDSVDEYPNDNIAKYSFYVTSNVLSKGRYDFSKGQAFMGSYIRTGDNVDFMLGNLHYIAKGGYQFEKVQLSISNGSADDNSIASVAPITVWVYKWVDGSNGLNTDGVMQAGELTQIGAANKSFQSGDTNNQVFVVNIADPVDANKKVVTEDDTWYWVVADVPSGVFFGCDGEINYQPRAYFREMATPSFVERYTALRGANSASLTDPTEVLAMYPFERGQNGADSSRFAEQKKGTVPALPIYMSVFPVSVENTTPDNSFNVELYPNPVSDVLNVSIKLEKAASKAYYSVVDAFGRTVSREARENVKEENYSVSTTNLAPGNYYFVIHANDKVTSRKFTVVK